MTILKSFFTFEILNSQSVLIIRKLVYRIFVAKFGFDTLTMTIIVWGKFFMIKSMIIVNHLQTNYES